MFSAVIVYRMRGY